MFQANAKKYQNWYFASKVAIRSNQVNDKGVTGILSLSLADAKAIEGKTLCVYPSACQCAVDGSIFTQRKGFLEQ